jgi:hypothetical protein
VLHNIHFRSCRGCLDLQQILISGNMQLQLAMVLTMQHAGVEPSELFRISPFLCPQEGDSPILAHEVSGGDMARLQSGSKLKESGEIN